RSIRRAGYLRRDAHGNGFIGRNGRAQARGDRSLLRKRMNMPISTRLLVPLLGLLSIIAAETAHAQAYCAPPKAVPSGPPSPPPPPVCQPRTCNKCTTSPCYVDSGIYVNDALDLSIPTNGFSLLVARHYDSS